MWHLRNHTPNGRSVFTAHNLIEAFESQALDNQSMFIGRPDLTAIILDFQHCAGFACSFLFGYHRLQFLDLFAAQFGYLTRLPQSFQTIESRLDHIVRVGTAK